MWGFFLHFWWSFLEIFFGIFLFSFVLEGNGSILMSNVMSVFSASIAYCILINSQKYFIMEYTYIPKIEVCIYACFVPTAALIAAL